MADQAAPVFANRLLAVLPDEDRRTLALVMEPVTLSLGQKLEEPGCPIEQVYFVETGMVSVVSAINGQNSAEVGMIGPEGLTGSALALGDRVPSFRTFVQIAGSGNCMTAGHFETALREHPQFASLIMQYTRVLWTQAMSTAVANVQLKLTPRLARWLLMVDDRIEGSTIHITHEFLAMMLHARRPGITEALHILEGERLIQARRGVVQVKDRSGLMELAAGSYGVAEADYRRLIG